MTKLVISCLLHIITICFILFRGPKDTDDESEIPRVLYYISLAYLLWLQVSYFRLLILRLTGGA